jgi:hypothetical protein
MKEWRAASLEQPVPIFIGKIPFCGIVGCYYGAQVFDVKGIVGSFWIASPFFMSFYKVYGLF